MIKGLYDIFAHWYHGGQIYFYSDPHFSDDEMKFLRKNYIGDDEQVRRINSKVGKNDTIIFLGDIGKKDYIKQIRGYKILICGNHDEGAHKYEDYFDEIYRGALTISDRIILSHEPIDLPFMFNIHGHDHSQWQRADNMHYNVCAEHINYTPVSLKSIIESGALKDIPTIHRLTIDNAIIRSQYKNKA